MARISGVPLEGTVARTAYNVVEKSNVAMFADQVAAQIAAKKSTVTSAFFDLVAAGVMRCARVDREGSVSAVFFLTDAQTKPFEGRMMPYVRRHVPRLAKRKGAPANAPEENTHEMKILFEIPNNGTLALTWEEAKKLYQTLHKVFGDR